MWVAPVFLKKASLDFFLLYKSSGFAYNPGGSHHKLNTLLGAAEAEARKRCEDGNMTAVKKINRPV